MRNLIAAGFRQLFRYGRFAPVTLTAALLSGIAAGFFGRMPAGEGTFVFRPDIFIYTLPLLLLLMAVTLVLGIGQEQSSGTIRNKMIAGYTKLSVVGAWVTVTLCFSLLTGLLYLIPVYLLGGGALQLIGGKALLRMMLTVLLLFPVIGVLSALMSLLFRRQVFAAAGILGLTALCFVTALIVRGKLEEPEYTETETKLINYIPVEPDEHITVEDGCVLYDGAGNSGYYLNDGGIFVKREYTARFVYSNPFFLRSPQREVWTVLNHLNPADAFIAASQTMMAGICETEIARNEQYYQEETEYLKKALKNAEQNHDPAAAAALEGQLYDQERNYRSSVIENAQQRDIYADETRSLPQCMLAVLILMTAAGILVFRRLDIV